MSSVINNGIDFENQNTLDEQSANIDIKPNAAITQPINYIDDTNIDDTNTDDTNVDPSGFDLATGTIEGSASIPITDKSNLDSYTPDSFDRMDRRQLATYIATSTSIEDAVDSFTRAFDGVSFSDYMPGMSTGDKMILVKKRAEVLGYSKQSDKYRMMNDDERKEVLDRFAIDNNLDKSLSYFEIEDKYKQSIDNFTNIETARIVIRNKDPKGYGLLLVSQKNGEVNDETLEHMEFIARKDPMLAYYYLNYLKRTQIKVDDGGMHRIATAFGEGASETAQGVALTTKLASSIATKWQEDHPYLNFLLAFTPFGVMKVGNDIAGVDSEFVDGIKLLDSGNLDKVLDDKGNITAIGKKVMEDSDLSEEDLKLAVKHGVSEFNRRFGRRVDMAQKRRQSTDSNMFSSVLQQASGSAPQMLVDMAAFAVNPALGLGTTFLNSSGNSVLSSLDQNIAIDNAISRMVIEGSVIAGLESIGLHGVAPGIMKFGIKQQQLLIKSVAKSASKTTTKAAMYLATKGTISAGNFMLGSAEEAITEIMQDTFSNAINSIPGWSNMTDEQRSQAYSDIFSSKSLLNYVLVSAAAKSMGVSIEEFIKIAAVHAKENGPTDLTDIAQEVADDQARRQDEADEALRREFLDELFNEKKRRQDEADDLKRMKDKLYEEINRELLNGDPIVPVKWAEGEIEGMVKAAEIDTFSSNDPKLFNDLGLEHIDPIDAIYDRDPGELSEFDIIFTTDEKLRAIIDNDIDPAKTTKRIIRANKKPDLKPKKKFKKSKLVEDVETLSTLSTQAGDLSAAVLTEDIAKKLFPHHLIKISEDGYTVGVGNLTIKFDNRIDEAGISEGNTITLNPDKMSPNLISHEIYHSLENELLTIEEIKVLEDAGFTDEEKRAEGFADYMDKTVDLQKNSLVSRVFNQIKKFFSLIKRHNRIFEKVRTSVKGVYLSKPDGPQYMRTNPKGEKVSLAQEQINMLAEEVVIIAANYDISTTEVIDKAIGIQALEKKYQEEIAKRSASLYTAIHEEYNMAQYDARSVVESYTREQRVKLYNQGKGDLYKKDKEFFKKKYKMNKEVSSKEYNQLKKVIKNKDTWSKDDGSEKNEAVHAIVSQYIDSSDIEQLEMRTELTTAVNDGIANNNAKKLNQSLRVLKIIQSIDYVNKLGKDKKEGSAFEETKESYISDLITNALDIDVNEKIGSKLDENLAEVIQNSDIKKVSPFIFSHLTFGDKVKTITATLSKANREVIHKLIVDVESSSIRARQRQVDFIDNFTKDLAEITKLNNKDLFDYLSNEIPNTEYLSNNNKPLTRDQLLNLKISISTIHSATGKADNRLNTINDLLTERDFEIIDYVIDNIGQHTDELKEVANKFAVGVLEYKGEKQYKVPQVINNKGGFEKGKPVFNILPSSLGSGYIQGYDIDTSVGIIGQYVSSVNADIFYIEKAESAVDVLNTLLNKHVANAIIDKFGHRIFKSIQEHVTDIFNANSTKPTPLEEVDMVTGFFLSSKLFFNLGSAAGQLGSMGLYGNAETGFTGKQNFDYSNKRPEVDPITLTEVIKIFGEMNELKTRRTKSNRTQILESVNSSTSEGFGLKNSKGKQIISKILKLGGLPTSWGDIAGVYGGAPLYKNAYNKAVADGLSTEECHKFAKKQFLYAMETTQQSSLKENLSEYQRRYGSIARAVGAFQGTSMLMASPFFRSIAVAKQTGLKEDVVNASKIYARLTLANILYSTLGGLARGLLNDEDEIWDNTDNIRVLAQVLSGPFGGIIVFGSVISSLTSYMVTAATSSNPRYYKKTTPADNVGEIVASGINIVTDLANSKSEKQVYKSITKFLGSVTPVAKSIDRNFIESKSDKRKRKRREKLRSKSIGF